MRRKERTFANFFINPVNRISVSGVGMNSDPPELPVKSKIGCFGSNDNDFSQQFLGEKRIDRNTATNQEYPVSIHKTNHIDDPKKLLRSLQTCSNIEELESLVQSNPQFVKTDDDSNRIKMGSNDFDELMNESNNIGW